MKAYLAAHDSFISWLDQTADPPTTAEVDQRLLDLAMCAAQRGMLAVHWMFVVDGLVAYVGRRWPGNVLLSSCVARGFDLSAHWDVVRAASEKAGDDLCSNLSSEN